jgi:hypothetical protein
MSLWKFRTRLRKNQDRHSRKDVCVSSTCKGRTETWSVSPSVDMLPFGVTIPATVPQTSDIPERLINYSVLVTSFDSG